MKFSVLCAAIAVPAIAGITALPANAAGDIPVRKPGHWEITTVAAAIGMRTIQACIAPGDDIVSGIGEPGCSAPDVERTGDQVVVSMVCKTKGGTERISTLLTGDFTTWYRATSKMTLDPAPPGSAMGATIDAKYIGPDCPPETGETPHAAAK